MKDRKSIRRPRRAARLASWAAILSLAGLSLSPSLTRAQGSYYVSTVAIVAACNGFVDLMEDTDSGFGVATAGSGGSRSCGPVSASSSSTANAGFNFVAASAGASSTGVGSASGNGGGTSQSSFVVDAPGLTGTLGSMLWGFNVNGSVAAVANDSGGSTAGASYSLALDTTVDQFLLDESIQRFHDSGVAGGLTLGSQGYRVDIRFGEVITFDLGAVVFASAGAVADGTASAVAAFNNTFAWDGILEVMDASGASVADYTAQDGLGRDWSLPHAAPVPEVSSAWLFIAGLGAFLGWRRRSSARTGGSSAG